MSAKSFCAILAVSLSLTVGLSHASAAGHGAKGGPHRDHAARRGANYWGYGGLGYGCGYSGWDWPWAYGLSSESLPYFAVFPPVYYGNPEPTLVVNPTVAPSSAKNEMAPSFGGALAASHPQRQPLVIVNPYYHEDTVPNAPNPAVPQVGLAKIEEPKKP
jgi:hypothetical protein